MISSHGSYIEFWSVKLELSCNAKIAQVIFLTLLSYGIYPMRSLETANCPVCGYELLHMNITGDIDSIVESLDETVEPYKSHYVNNGSV